MEDEPFISKLIPWMIPLGLITGMAGLFLVGLIRRLLF